MRLKHISIPIGIWWWRAQSRRVRNINTRDNLTNNNGTTLLSPRLCSALHHDRDATYLTATSPPAHCARPDDSTAGYVAILFGDHAGDGRERAVGIGEYQQPGHLPFPPQVCRISASTSTHRPHQQRQHQRHHCFTEAWRLAESQDWTSCTPITTTPRPLEYPNTSRGVRPPEPHVSRGSLSCSHFVTVCSPEDTGACQRPRWSTGRACRPTAARMRGWWLGVARKIDLAAALLAFNGPSPTSTPPTMHSRYPACRSTRLELPRWSGGAEPTGHK